MQPYASRPTSIRLFLVDGRPEGLRLVEKSNWTGLGVVCSRSDYPQARKRDEWGRPGIYLLTGPPTDRSLRERLYVGEADDLRERLDTHAKNKDFWTAVVAFTTKDDNLNKAHVRYLEARLLQVARVADRADLQNGTAPQLPRLSEADQADMEGFLAETLLMLPLVGVTAFVALDTPSATATAATLHLKGKGAQATGSDTPEGFLVFAGSLARIDTVPSIHTYLDDLRQRLANDGVLVVDGDRLRFTKTYAFDSPSTAAGVVLGRSANGRVEWRDDHGVSLKQLQDAALS